LVDDRWAAVDRVQAQIEQAEEENADDQRRMTDYTYEIRNARNMLRVTQAVLIAERTNIQLMVAIKNEMNMGEDIIGLAETEVKL
jgi:chromosome segregation ATPase